LLSRLWQFASLLCLLVTASAAQAQTAPGTVIANSAQIDYLQGATSLQVRSNTVSATVQSTSTPSVLSILRFAPSGAARIFRLQLYRKRRLDDIGFPIDAGGFSGACGNIVCNKDCNICCKALRQFWREVCG